MALNKKKKEKYLESAQKYAQKQQFDKAAKDFELAFEEDKKDAGLAKKIGDTYIKIKKQPEAIKFFRYAAIGYAKDGFWPKSIAVYKQILQMDDSSVDIRLEIADLHFKQGVMAEALAQYRWALNKFENEKQVDKAIEVVRKMLEIEAHNVNYRVKLADLLFKSNKRDPAYQEFKKAADDLKKAKRWDDLVNLYDLLVKHDPTNSANYMGFGEALAEKGDFKRATETYQLLLKYAPEDAEAYEKMGLAYQRMSDTSNAVLSLKKAALLAEKKGNKAQALEYWKKVHIMHPGDEEAKKHVGDAKAAPTPPPTSQSAQKPSPAGASAPTAKPRAFNVADEDLDSDEPIQLPEADPETMIQPSIRVDEELPLQNLVEEEDLTPVTADQVDSFLIEADTYLNYTLLDKAQALVNRILKSFPENYEAMKIAALIQKENGKPKLAAQGLLKAAQVARKKNDPDKAKQYAEEILTIDPANAQAQAMLAELDSGPSVEISLGDEPEEASIEPEVEESLSLEVEDEELSLIEDAPPKKAVQPAAKKKPVDDEPLSLIDEVGSTDEQLMLVDDEPEPTVKLVTPTPKPAPAKAAPQPAPKPAAKAPPPPPKPVPAPRETEPMMMVEDDDEEISIEASAPPPKPAPKPVPAPQAKSPTPPPAVPKPVAKTPTPPPKAPPPPAINFDAEMEEAEFFINQGLMSEAEKAYNKILAASPDYGPALEGMKALARKIAEGQKTAPILEEIEEVELEVEAEAQEEEIPSFDDAVDAAEETLDQAFAEEKPAEPEVSLEASEPELEEMSLEVEEEAEPEPTPEPQLDADAGAFGEVALEESDEQPSLEAEAPVEEEELSVEAEEEVVEQEAAPEPEPVAEPEVEQELEVTPEVEEEEPASEPEPKPVSAAAEESDDEWEAEEEEEEEAPAETPVEKPAEAQTEAQKADAMEDIADAADDAWGNALEPETEEKPAEAQAKVHPDLDRVAEATEEAFGAAFGEEGGADDDDEFDLSSALGGSEPVEEATAKLEDESGPLSMDDIASIIQSQRDQVVSQIGHDATAHFDLGIAYKEMGLHGEAINSFRLALKAGANMAHCLNMIGLCFRDQGELPKAETVFREGLKQKNLKDEDTIILKYELGLVLQDQERLSEALEMFREVIKINQHFRDVETLVIGLDERLGGPSEKPRDRISYI